MSTLVLFPGEPGRWLRIDSGAIIARGSGPIEAMEDEEGLRVVGIVSARDVVVHHIALPDLTDAQARGAARIAVGETVMAPLETLHVAVGTDNQGERTVVGIDKALMAERLADFAAHGFDPDAMIPASLILPRPESGFLRADLGNEIVVRGREAAFADDPVLTQLLTNDELTTLEGQIIEDAIIVAAANPEVDLRQGIFAKRRRWALDADRLRRIKQLAVACLAITFVIAPVRVWHMSRAANRVEAANIAAAQAALPPGTVVVNPVAQLDERLAALGGGGGGFLGLASIAGAAADATANVEAVTMIYEGDSTLRLNARATTPAELSAFESRIIASGVTVTPGPIVTGAGLPSRELMVRAR